MRSLGAGRRTTRISAGLRQRLAYWQGKLPLLLNLQICHTTIDLSDGFMDGDAGNMDGHLVLSDGTVFGSPNLSAALADASQMCCFVVTVGPGVEIAVNDCVAANRHADAFILDTLGSMAAEALIDGFHKDVERECRSRGQGVTLRFSPGYCDWDITDQIHLFSLFKEKHPANVELTESCLMSPCKSISGVFGILPAELGNDIAKYNPCKSCRQSRCRARRI